MIMSAVAYDDVMMMSAVRTRQHSSPMLDPKHSANSKSRAAWQCSAARPSTAQPSLAQRSTAQRSAGHQLALCLYARQLLVLLSHRAPGFAAVDRGVHFHVRAQCGRGRSAAYIVVVQSNDQLITPPFFEFFEFRFWFCPEPVLANDRA